MKKIISLLLVMVVVFSLGACGSDQPDSTSDSTSVTTTTDNTTDDKTQPSATDPITDTTEPSEVLPDGDTIACEHKFDVTFVKESTCIDSGCTESTCTKCGESITAETAPLGHSYGSDGLCSRCGEKDPNYQEGSADCDHEHQITGRTDATCTKTGQITYACGKCSHAYSETIPAKEHSYSSSTCTKPSTCNACGSSVGIALGHSFGSAGLCVRCGAQDPNYKEEPAEPDVCRHSYTITGRKDTTCTETGSVTYTCGKCRHSYQESIPASGHQYASATCEKPQTCSACSATLGSALGHSYGSDYLCIRCGAVDPTAPVEFTVTVKSDKGNRVANVTVTVYTDTPTQPAGSASTNSNGVATIKLDKSSCYRVVLSNIPTGLAGKDSYNFTATRANITLTSVSIIDPLDHSKAQYKVGSTMGEFTAMDTDGNSHTLSQLLKEKKLVILNFWYVNCGPCKAEFPFFETAYQKYKDDVAILAFDPFDNESGIRALKAQMGLSFPMLKDNLGLHQGFGVTAYPTTVFIGNNGKILQIKHSEGYESEDELLQIIKGYVGR